MTNYELHWLYIRTNDRRRAEKYAYIIIVAMHFLRPPSFFSPIVRIATGGDIDVKGVGREALNTALRRPRMFSLHLFEKSQSMATATVVCEFWKDRQTMKVDDTHYPLALSHGIERAARCVRNRASLAPMINILTCHPLATTNIQLVTFAHVRGRSRRCLTRHGTMLFENTRSE